MYKQIIISFKAFIDTGEDTSDEEIKSFIQDIMNDNFDCVNNKVNVHFDLI
jgi:hypothetical protein